MRSKLTEMIKEISIKFIKNLKTFLTAFILLCFFHSNKLYFFVFLMIANLFTSIIQTLKKER